VINVHPTDVVRDYCESLGPTNEAYWSSFERFFDDSTVWENVGLARTVGKAEAIAFAKTFPLSFDHMRVEDLRMVADGETVYNERVDHFCDRMGTPLVTVRIAGVFVVRSGRLAHWRDYFDTAGFGAAVAAAGSGGAA
jgi:limonene-1,2-epoxide hydrolase